MTNNFSPSGGGVNHVRPRVAVCGVASVIELLHRIRVVVDRCFRCYGGNPGVRAANVLW